MSHQLAATDQTPSAVDSSIELVYRKVVRHILPVLFLGYVLCTLDRLNIGYAHLQMKADLGISDAAYGLGAGLFFLTYMAFEVPSSFMLARIGVRKTILRIMFGWGLVSAATMFVASPTQFYIARLLLGMCEAGFFPAIIYYFSLWLPPHRRGRIIAAFMSAIVVASVVGGPLSGLIMDRMNDYLGLRGWQWLFLLEGIPSCVVAVFAYFKLSDRPETASFLSADERAALMRALAAEQGKESRGHSAGAFREVLQDWRIYAFALVFYLTTSAAYGLAFWGPAIVRSFGVQSIFEIGLLIGGPSILAGLAMWLNGLDSDHRMERRWHFAVPAIVCATALFALASSSWSLGVSVALLGLAAIGIQAAVPVFWTVPSGYLSAPVAATGIALINTLAVLSGFVTPWLLGVIKEQTGSFRGGIVILGASALAAGIAMLVFAPRRR